MIGTFEIIAFLFLLMAAIILIFSVNLLIKAEQQLKEMWDDVEIIRDQSVVSVKLLGKIENLMSKTNWEA